jgi:hypothetical protein
MSSVLTAVRTLGISPKAVAAFVYPALVAVSAAVVSWIATGNFDATEIRTSLGGLIAGAVAALGAYLHAPGTVEVE